MSWGHSDTFILRSISTSLDRIADALERQQRPIVIVSTPNPASPEDAEKMRKTLREILDEKYPEKKEA